jgi:hypothetical protein
MRPLDDYIKKQLDRHLDSIGKQTDADGLAILSPIVPGLDSQVRDAVETLSRRKPRIAIILDTNGGVVEVVERIVETIRNVYDDVTVIVPDRAMSAGTIFALAADRIMMDYFSCLGPIDPQVEKDGKLVPALSYLNQFERLNAKANAGTLTTAEYALLSKLDLGELYQFEQARELSIELLIKWLSKYKFKDWQQTESRGMAVTDEMKRERAREIAGALNNTERWHSHGRGIDMRTLTTELKLKIDDYSSNTKLRETVREYFELLRDYMMRQQLFSFVHTREYF